MAANFLDSLRSLMPAGGYRYDALSGHDDDRRRKQRPERRRRLLVLGALISLVLLFIILIPRPELEPQPCEWTGSCYNTSSHSWGQYSPFFSVPSKISTDTPSGCVTTFALVLARHGARDPTAHKSDVYQALIERIQSSVYQYGEGYQFIRDYGYTLGKDQLTWFGEQQMVDCGTSFWERYKSLADNFEPFIRAAGSERVIASAKNFTQGFYKAQGLDGTSPAEDILIVPETENFNNSMNHGGCPAFEDGPVRNISVRMQKTWVDSWVPNVRDRLNEKLPGANLTDEETIFMMDLCPFSTVAEADGTLSDFCKIFSESEWANYDYFESLDKWYGHGLGNPLGPTQGVGYVNELIARLLHQPVEDNTSTNSTLDSSPKTFPLDARLYADFSHDNSMTSIFAAMGLHNNTEDLSPRKRTSPVKANGYSAAWTVPFAGRMYVEKMMCGGQAEEMVRVLINDRVVPLVGCKPDRLGRCSLGNFVESLSFARTGGRWDECFTAQP